jgi:hypothetical protein
MRCSISVLALLSALGLASRAVAADALSVSAGADYSRGDYGGASKTEIWYFPVMLKYEADPLTLKLTVPYLKITGPSDVVVAAGEPIQLGQDGGRRSESGMGDVIAAATFSVYENAATGVLIDVTGKFKFATADENKGLGTGENDQAFQGDVTKSFGATSVFGTLGWKRFGDPPGVDFRNPWFASLGSAYRFTADTSGGIMYDYRQRVTARGAHMSEATAFVSHKLTPLSRAQIYLVKGFSDGSPDWGAGALLTKGF